MWHPPPSDFCLRQYSGHGNAVVHACQKRHPRLSRWFKPRLGQKRARGPERSFPRNRLCQDSAGARNSQHAPSRDSGGNRVCQNTRWPRTGTATPSRHLRRSACVKTREASPYGIVIPAEAGIQGRWWGTTAAFPRLATPGFRFRGNDVLLRSCHGSLDTACPAGTTVSGGSCRL